MAYCRDPLLSLQQKILAIWQSTLESLLHLQQPLVYAIFTFGLLPQELKSLLENPATGKSVSLLINKANEYHKEATAAVNKLEQELITRVCS